MINTSTEYKQALEEKRNITAKATCILKDGTQLDLGKNNFFGGGVAISDGVSSSGHFDIGSAIVNQLTLVIDNADETFSDYNFTDAVITAWVGMQLSDRVEWLKKGVFNASDPTTTPAVLTLKALDNMAKFDNTYDGKMSFPTTLQAIVQYCCNKCGVLLHNGQFPNYNYRISKNPFEGDNSNITYRALISYCALLSGCYARCNADGRLELKWYDTAAFEGIIDGGIFDQTTSTHYQTGDSLDGGNFTDYNGGDNADGGTFTENLPYHHIYSFSSLSVSTEDVVITGIRVTAADSEDSAGNKIEGETYLCGAEGYILEVSGNPLIEAGKAREVAEYLASRVVGMRFRPFNASCIGDPSMEAGDAAIITDRKGNSYNTYLTNITYNTGNYANITCDAEPAARHSADRYSQIEQIVANIKKDNQQKLSQYAQYVDQLNTLAINAMGYYETVEKQDDGSIIKYMHDKPLLSESKTVFKNSIDGFFWSHDGGKTWTMGVSKDGNAVMNVIAAIGIAAEWIDTRGFKATDDNGNVTFEIDANTGKVRIVAETFSLSGKSILDIANGAVTELDKKLTSNEVFNRLTNNGKIQGVYMLDEQLYINFNYARGGTLKLGQVEGESVGKLEIWETVSNVGSRMIGSWDEHGIMILNGSIRLNGTTNQASFSVVDGKMTTTRPHVKGSLSMGTVDGSFEFPVFRITAGNLLNIGSDGDNKFGSMYIRAKSISIEAEETNNPTVYVRSKLSVGSGISTSSYTGVTAKFSGKVEAYQLSVSGAKSRIAETQNYNRRLLYCYETPTPYFGDIGTGRTDEDGLCYVSIDDIFQETINIGEEYSVFLQKEGAGDLWVEEKTSTFFVVQGTPGLPFSWEIKAVQKDYEYLRLEDYNLQDDIVDEKVDLEDIFDKELNNYDREMEELQNEYFESISGD